MERRLPPRRPPQPLGRPPGPVRRQRRQTLRRPRRLHRPRPPLRRRPQPRPLAQAAKVVLAGDTSHNAMRIARKVTAKAGADNVLFQETDVFATALPDASVDGVFCWDLLGHLTEPVKALQELYRICRPGGHVVANMWTMADCQVADPGMVAIGPKEYRDHADFYCKFYDRPDLDAYLTRCGLTDEVAAVERLRWMEPPHAGYRPYFHEHESLAFTIRKNGG
ncbi:class I SAM-dependent methyltransferase [Streptomyces sp. LBUM 1476]|nr:class I SAM-dependent methyltransferase [Streptomyces sp. LBUM 1476]